MGIELSSLVWELLPGWAWCQGVPPRQQFRGSSCKPSSQVSCAFPGKAKPGDKGQIKERLNTVLLGSYFKHHFIVL